jgi:hypothetical protein
MKGIGLLGAALLLMGSAVVSAQTMSFEQAAKLLLSSCGKDISKYCSKVNIGDGRMRNCLLNTAAVSAGCKAQYAHVVAGIQKRAEARIAVRKICERDALQLCGSVKIGDGQLLDCLLASKRGISARCSQAITDAGYR